MHTTTFARARFLVKASLFSIILLAAFIQVTSVKTYALSGSDFQAGRIMDDVTFFNGNAMSSGDIQRFLNAKVPTCDTWGGNMHSSGQTRGQYGASKGYPGPYTCLKDYVESTPNKAAENGLCNYYAGGTKSANQIIYDVGMVCGVSQKVLLVLLQKEQSLVTDDWPWSNQYRSATGYGCPDTAPCDAEYYGFFNQVYNAARIYKKYMRDSANYNYRAQRNNTIRYNPNVNCGSSMVYIQNQATAGLYVYTPYQPNPAALNNLYGSGDGCSAYGNRNFWRLYNDWFGSSLSNETFSPHPNGTLYTDGQFVFRVENGTRRHVGAAAFAAYGYEWSKVKTASIGDRNLTPGAPQWSVPAGTVFTSGDGTVYVADDRTGTLKKQWISAKTFTDLGYNWSQIIKTDSNSEAPAVTEPGFYLPSRHPSGAIVNIDNKIYMIDKYKKRYISAVAFTSNSLRWGMVTPATPEDRTLPEDTPLDLRAGTILYSGGGIYVVDTDANGTLKRPIGPWECYNDRLRFVHEDWITVPEATLPSRTGALFTC